MKATVSPKFQEAPESILLIRWGIVANSISSYWERTDQFVRLRLERCRLRRLLEGQLRGSRFKFVGHSRATGQLCQQGLEAVHREPLCGFMGVLLGLGRVGGFRRQNRIASLPFLSPLLILEQ